MIRKISKRVGHDVVIVAGKDRDSLERQFGTERQAGNDFKSRVQYSADIGASFDAAAVAVLANSAAAATVDSAVARRQVFYLERYMNRGKIKEALSAAYEGLEVSYVDNISDIKKTPLDRIIRKGTTRGKKIAREGILQFILNWQERRYVRVNLHADTRYLWSQYTSTENPTTDIYNYASATQTLGYVVSGTAPGGATSQTYPSVVTKPVDYAGKEYPSAQHRYKVQSVEPRQEDDVKDGIQDKWTLSYTYTGLPVFGQAENELRHKEFIIQYMDALLADAIGAGRFSSFDDLVNEEMGMVDAEVRRSQIALADTYLLPSFDGLVTALFKDEGETVQAGEPVMRVEDDKELLLIAWVRHKKPIRVSQPVTIVADKLFETPHQVAIDGTVVAVRGHSSDDDEWDLVLQVTNDPAQWRIPGIVPDATWKLPLNYHFDRETTTIVFK